MSEKNIEPGTRKLRVGITHGDMNGIGYEVILKTLSNPEITEIFTPVIFGSSEVAARSATRLNLEDFWFSAIEAPADAKEGQINLVDVCGQGLHQTLGIPSKEAGEMAVKALEAACNALEKGEIDVIVTAPIDKNSVQKEDFHFPGHTEYLEAKFGNGEGSATMILASDSLRVALVTTHLSLKDVPSKITKENVERAIVNFNESLKKDFSCERPVIAVLSLNPHCGDGGLLGDEEMNEIAPAIESCKEKGIVALGPVAADGLFGSGAYTRYDGILAMYHDQGLAPFKALARENGINFTAGLSIVRTSPDHGTAYDKAGLGTADETSFRQAVYAALDIARRRETYVEASENPLKIQPQKLREPKKNREKNDFPGFIREEEKSGES